MKLVVFGLTVSSSWGNGHATLWRGLIRGLARRGVRVVFLERDVPYYAEHRDLHSLSHLGGGGGDGGGGGGGATAELLLYRDWTGAVAAVKPHLADADAVMVTSYCPDGPAACDLALASNVPVKTFYDLDTPITLDRLAAGETVDYLPANGLGGFDLVLSYTGGAALDALRTTLGARTVAPLYGSVDPSVHRPVEPQPHYRADLSYLGTYAADRQPAVEALFVEPARRRPERRFVIGGAMYPQDFPWTANTHFVQHLPPGEHPAFFSSSRLTLNVTRASMKRYGWCPSGRLFEAAACGTPVLSDDWEGLGDFYTPGEEIVIAAATDDAVAALDLPDDRVERIVRNARDRTLSEHTADRRAEQLIDLLGGV